MSRGLVPWLGRLVMGSLPGVCSFSSMLARSFACTQVGACSGRVSSTSCYQAGSDIYAPASLMRSMQVCSFMLAGMIMLAAVSSYEDVTYYDFVSLPLHDAVYDGEGLHEVKEGLLDTCIQWFSAWHVKLSCRMGWPQSTYLSP